MAVLFNVTYEELIFDVILNPNGPFPESMAGITIGDMIDRLPLIGINNATIVNNNSANSTGVNVPIGANSTLNVTGNTTLGDLGTLLFCLHFAFSLPSFSSFPVLFLLSLLRISSLSLSARQLNTTVDALIPFFLPNATSNTSGVNSSTPLSEIFNGTFGNVFGFNNFSNLNLTNIAAATPTPTPVSGLKRQGSLDASPSPTPGFTFPNISDINFTLPNGTLVNITDLTNVDLISLLLGTGLAENVTTLIPQLFDSVNDLILPTVVPLLSRLPSSTYSSSYLPSFSTLFLLCFVGRIY